MSAGAEAGRALLAGFVAGAAAAFATSAIVLIGMSRDDAWKARWRARLAGAERLPAPLLGVALVNGLLLGWTLLGLLLGAAYAGMGDPLRFGAVAHALALAALVAAGVVRGRVTAPMWGAALAAALAFGVLLPALAG